MPQFIAILATIVLLSACSRNRINTNVASQAEIQSETRLQGQPNFRDLGAYETSDGRKVKQGVVFRSGELPRLTDEDVQQLQKLKIKGSM